MINDEVTIEFDKAAVVARVAERAELIAAAFAPYYTLVNWTWASGGRERVPGRHEIAETIIELVEAALNVTEFPNCASTGGIHVCVEPDGECTVSFSHDVVISA